MSKDKQPVRTMKAMVEAYEKGVADGVRAERARAVREANHHLFARGVVVDGVSYVPEDAARLAVAAIEDGLIYDMRPPPPSLRSQRVQLIGKEADVRAVIRAVEREAVAAAALCVVSPMRVFVEGGE